MRNLINFILKYSRWFLFAFYVLLSLMLLFSGRAYHQSVYLTSANAVAGNVYGVAANVTGYFNLREINRQLHERNAMLENEVLELNSRIIALQALVSDTTGGLRERRYGYVLGSVINNSVLHPRNYFTIDIGSDQGIEPGMGVVDQNGIVGIVNVCGRNTSRVISLLNRSQHFSVKLKGSPYVGTLSWRGSDPTVAYMEEVPRHARYNIGDTVVTSGYSTTFPEGLDAGYVMARVKSQDDNYYVLKVRLSSDFRSLSTVRVIKDVYKQQLDSLAAHDIKTDE